MKLFIKLILLGALLALGDVAAMAQNQVQSGEYFWDTDPGVGNGTPLTAVDGSFNQSIEEVLLNTTSLPAAGPHLLSIRVRGRNNAWGTVFSTVVDVQASAIASIRPISVTAGEYFWDADPGQGNGTVLIAFDGNFNQAIEAATASTTTFPSVGAHTLNVRVRGGDNTWGTVFSVVVDVQASAISSIRPISVTAGEYFWDTDPGQGNGTVLIAFDGNFNQAIEAATASTTTFPSVGAHTLNVRVRGGDNTWGTVFSVVVDVQASAISSIRPISVTSAEYFWDADPGQGNGTVMLALDGNFNQAIESITASSATFPAVGAHTLNVRVRGGDNTWGTVFSVVVDVQGAALLAIRPIRVTAGEYYLDTDPGQGNATAMLSFDGTFNGVIEALRGGNIPSPIIAGPHTLYMRARGGDNSWGPSFGVVVNIDTTIGSFTSQINGPISLCSNQRTGVLFSSPVSSGNTYAWTINGGNITNGTGTANITVDWNATGPYTLQLIECNNGATVCDTANITVTILPTAQSSITQTICQGQSYLGYTTSGTFTNTYTAANGCDSVRTLVLTVVSGITTTLNQTICQGQSFLGYTTSGTYVNTYTASNGCDSTRTLVLTVTAAPSTTVNQTICFGASFLGYSANGTYRDTFTIAGGCDSIRVLNLTVRTQSTATVNASICPGGSYEGYTTAGTYINVYTNQFGCDSTRTLNLTVSNAATSTINQTICFGGSFQGYSTTGVYRDTFTVGGGCDSIRILNLTVRPNNTSTIAVSICSGGSYAGYTTAGTYTDTYTGANGCDSTRTVTLNVRPVNATTVNVSICPGSSYAGYTMAGTYTDTYTGANGCDSIRTLNLTVQSLITNTITQTVCFGGSYQGYTASGTYRDTFSLSGGCDSIRVLNLTVRPANTRAVSASICPGGSFAGYTSAGTFIDVYTDQYGCDSTRTLTLTVASQSTTNVDTTICFGGSYQGYSAAGIYRDTFAVGTGCDSIRVLTLVIRSQNSSLVNQTICSGQSFEGFTTSGVYVDTLTDQYGCDSIRTLNLTVSAAIERIVSQTICEGDTFQGQTLAGTYRDTITTAGGCDSVLVLNLSVDALPTLPVISRANNILSVPATYSSYQWYQDGSILIGATGSSIAVLTNGTYTVVVGNAANCKVEATALQVTGVGIGDVKPTWNLEYYPNPTDGVLYLTLAGAPQSNWTVYNSLGQLLQAGEAKGNATEIINLSMYADGVYYLKVQIGDEIATRKLLLAK